MAQWYRSLMIEPANIANHNKIYEELVKDQSFLENFDFFSKVTRRDANVFSIVLSILDEQPTEVTPDISVQLIQGFFPFLKGAAQFDQTMVSSGYRKNIEDRTKTRGQPFQYNGNWPKPFLHFNSWFLVGDEYPLPIEDMIFETRFVIKQWIKYLHEYRLEPAISVAFGGLSSQRLDLDPSQRVYVGTAYNESGGVAEELFSLNKHQFDFSDLGILICNHLAGRMLFGGLIGRELKSEDEKVRLRLTLTSELDLG